MEYSKKIMGSRIRDLREARSMSITALAKEVGIERPTLGNIEHGRKGPSYEVAARICQYFDVSMDYLIGLTDNPKHFR